MKKSEKSLTRQTVEEIDLSSFQKPVIKLRLSEIYGKFIPSGLHAGAVSGLVEDLLEDLFEEAYLEDQRNTRR